VKYLQNPECWLSIACRVEIVDAIDGEVVDAEVIELAEAIIDAAYVDAALLAAELIDEANLEAAAVVISDTWVVEEASARLAGDGLHILSCINNVEIGIRGGSDA
jgi:hypothetical protein